MHKLLERQLRRHFGSLEAVPAEMVAFVDDVSAAYAEADADRTLLERSLELTSEELVERNTQLQTDIGELAKTKKALEESSGRYRRIVDTATEGIWVLDEEGRTTFANARMAKLLDEPQERVMENAPGDYLDDDGRRKFADLLSGREAGETAQADVRFRRADGSDLWAIVSTSPVIDSAGSYQGHLAMVADITDRHRADERLKEAYVQLQELVLFRTQFINNTAHELATPMTPIILQIHLLKKALSGHVGDDQLQSLIILERNIERLGQLVNDVLDAARLQAGKMSLHRRDINLNEVVSDAVDSYFPVAREKGVELKLHRGEPLVVAGDPARLSQVFFNLLGNAIKFTPAGGRIDVSTWREREEALISVRDTGMGIAAPKVERLFEPFSQVHDTMKRTETGTGLGLYVSRGIVEAHDGQIWCESRGEGEGTSFFVRLRLARPESPEDVLQHRRLHAST